MPVFHLLSSNVVHDGEALFDMVSEVSEVLYLVVAYGCVDLFVQDFAEGSGKASGVGSSSASSGILGRPNNIFFLDPGVPKVGGRGVMWWQAGVLDDGVGKTDFSWRRHAACSYPWGWDWHAVWCQSWGVRPSR